MKESGNESPTRKAPANADAASPRGAAGQGSGMETHAEVAEVGASGAELRGPGGAELRDPGAAEIHGPGGAELRDPGGAEFRDPAAVVEALLFASDRPLPGSRIAQIAGTGTARDVQEHVEALNRRYASAGASFRIEAIAKGYQMMTLPAYDRWVRQLLETRRDLRLSPAALETLAIVAYKQPAMRAEIETVRGVACGEVLARLREMNLVKIVGRAEELGRPLLYGTTHRFLEVFGLGSLKDLPKAELLQPPGAAARSDANAGAADADAPGKTTD